MKRFLYYTAFLNLLILFFVSQAFAQSEDALYLYAGTTLDAAISADQSSGNPHSVYVLATTDTTYLFEQTIVISNSVTIRGVAGANGELPCIQPNVLQDASVPGQLFSFTGDNTVIKLENLYLLAASVNNTINWADGIGIFVNGNEIKTYIDNVVFEQWPQFAISYAGDWNSFWITNCKFRNMVHQGSVYTGEAFRMRNDLGAAVTDTVVMRYNTYLAVNAYAMAAPVGGYMNYAEFSHNTIISMVKNPFFVGAITNWKVEHNIFYGTYVGGMSNGEYPWWDRISGGLSSTIDVEPMTIVNAARFGIDTTLTDWDTQAEALRTVEVNDNIYFMPQVFLDFYGSVNDTASTANDSIMVCGWMNDENIAMFADETTYPGIVEDGNLVDTDPQYGSSITAMIASEGADVSEEYGIGAIPYISAARKNGAVANAVYGYQQSAPTGEIDWVPTWPLPEYTSGDLQYGADLMATDGKYYGDPFWFTGEVTGVEDNGAKPLDFVLKNAYPNPFNPSTVVEFSIPEAGNVSLKVYDILGREVLTLVNNEVKSAGAYKQVVDMNGFSSGIYFYSLHFNNNVQTKKMILMK